jgi:general secretion pathway protein A
MYLDHFDLKKKPFDISPNPEFLWLGEKHREGLAILKYGILENKGFLLITGDVGTGKTALIRAIEKDLEARAIVVTIPDPGMTLMDFYNFVAAELNMDRSFSNKGDFLIHFKRVILKAFSAYRRVLLIIDESQRLNHELMEEIRLLSNIDLAGKVLINVFFVGQTEFREILAQNENRAVRQRISVSYHLAPLTEDEVRQYIAHRLSIAGASQEIFTPEALAAVSRCTQGYPRLINIICDHALMSAYSRGEKLVPADLIQECADELKITIGRNLSAEKSPSPTPLATPKPVPASDPAAEPPPRAARSALIFAACLLVLGASWYFWGDSISDELARWGKAKEIRVARSTAETAEAERVSRVPPPAESLPREPAPSPVPAPPKKPPAKPAPAASPPEPPQAAAETQSASVTPPRSEPAPPAPAPAADALPAAKSAPPSAPAAAAAAASAAESFTLKGFTVFFTQNSTEIPVYANEVLISAATLMKSNSIIAAVIEGHTDSVGDPAYNRLISENRAASVKNFLVGQGIAPARLSISGFGSERPLESNSTPEGRSKNRRVVIRLVPGKQS